MGQNHCETLGAALRLSLAQQSEQGCVSCAFEFPPLKAIRAVSSATLSARDKMVLTAHNCIWSALKLSFISSAGHKLPLRTITMSTRAHFWELFRAKYRPI